MSLRLTTAFLASIALTAGCAEDPDTADEITGALEQDNGGLDFADEAPEFGAPELYSAAAIEGGAAVSDPMDGDAEVARLRGPAGLHRARVAIVWGQLPPDRTTPAARDWTGRISINRGALVVRRTIGFEEATDLVAPRETREVVQFRSTTRPFADGLVLEVLTDATDPSQVTLTYTSQDGTIDATLTLASLLTGPQTREVDALGNRVIVTALRDGDACDRGFLRGRWQALRPGLGRLVGLVSDADGAPIGHLRGIWGQRPDGARLFFSKYIDDAGRFRGLLAGTYADGDFHGRWIISVGDHGRVQGHYRDGAGEGAAGAFVGRWAETSCAADLPSS